MWGRRYVPTLVVGWRYPPWLSGGGTHLGCRVEVLSLVVGWRYPPWLSGGGTHLGCRVEVLSLVVGWRYPPWLSGGRTHLGCRVEVLSLLVVHCSLVPLQQVGQESMRSNISQGYLGRPFLDIVVSRSHVLRDAVQQLNGLAPLDLKKQLKVTFKGEEGDDEGGVRKVRAELEVYSY